MAKKNKKNKKNRKNKRKNLKRDIALKPFPAWMMGSFIFLLGLSGAWFGDMVSNHMFVKAIFAQIGICLFVFWWLYQNRTVTTLKLTFSWSRLLATALFLLATASVFWAVNKDFYVFKWLLWVAASGAFFLGLNIHHDQKNLTSLAWGLLCAGTVIAVVGILQYLTPLDTPRSAAAPASTFGNRNMATQVVVLTLPFSFYLLSLRSTKGFWSWMAAGFAGLMVVYLFYTTTRAAWVSITVAGLFGLSIYLPRKKAFQPLLDWSKQKTIATVAATLMTLCMMNFSDAGFKPFWRVLAPEVGSIVEYASDGGNRRFGIYRAGIEIAKKRPILGAGLGNYFHIKNVETNAQGKTFETVQTLGIQRVHNDYLELVIEIGVIGLLLFLAFGTTLLWSFFKLMRSEPNSNALFYLSLGCALAGTMTQALFSFPYQVAIPMVLLGLYSALLIKQSDSVITPIAEKSIVLGRSKKIILVGLFGYIGLFTIIVNLQWWQMYEAINDRVVVEARSAPLRAADPDAVGWETPMTFSGWFYHPEYQTLLKDTSKAYAAINKLPTALNILRTTGEYWPNEYELNLDHARIYSSLGKYEEAQAFMPKVTAMAPFGDFTGKFIQINNASAQGNRAELVRVYEEIKAESEAALLEHSSTLRQLHTMGAELSFAADVHRWYKLYRSKYPLVPTMETNEAVVYISLDKDNAAALPHMKASIELNPSNSNNTRFKEVIAELEAATASQ